MSEDSSVLGGGKTRSEIGNTEIGLGLTGFGVFFLFIGTLLLFDKGLLALGNLLFLSGIVVTIGIPSTVKFFTQKRNRRGSIAFLGGAALVVMGRTIIGLLIESVGFWLLFAAFIPTALAFLRKVPYLNKVLDLPLLKNIINKIAPMQGLPV